MNAPVAPETFQFTPQLVVAIVIVAFALIVVLVGMIRYKSMDDVQKIFVFVGPLLAAVGTYFFTSEAKEEQVKSAKQESAHLQQRVAQAATERQALAKQVADAGQKEEKLLAQLREEFQGKNALLARIETAEQARVALANERGDLSAKLATLSTQLNQESAAKRTAELKLTEVQLAQSALSKQAHELTGQLAAARETNDRLDMVLRQAVAPMVATPAPSPGANSPRPPRK